LALPVQKASILSLSDITDDQLERYARHLIMADIGGVGQAKLMQAKVLVVGAGGLGSPVLQYLAAAGIGTIGIVDDDVVDLSNLQRQIIHRTDAIGVSKVVSSANWIKAINPEVNVVEHNERLDCQNSKSLISMYDIIADGSDNFLTRLLVNDTCVAEKKVLVSAALGPLDGQVASFAPHLGTKNEPLPCYRCFMPEDPGPDGQRTCSDAGVLGPVAGVLGTLQATEICKQILGLGDLLLGKMMLFDAMSMSSRTIVLPADPACKTCGKQ